MGFAEHLIFRGGIVDVHIVFPYAMILRNGMQLVLVFFCNALSIVNSSGFYMNHRRLVTCIIPYGRINQTPLFLMAPSNLPDNLNCPA